MTTAPTYPLHSPAPWAEVVPGYGPVTVAVLLMLPDDGYIYEVVEGVLVRVAGSGNGFAQIMPERGDFMGKRGVCPEKPSP